MANQPARPVESYDEILAWAAARNAEFTHTPYCDHPFNGPHSCMSEIDAMLPGVSFSCRQTTAVVYATAWSEEETREPAVFVVVEKPLVDDVPPDDVLAEAWLTPSTARALAAQLLESARIAEGAQAIAESDARVSELGVLFRQVEAGDFATMDEVGAALRRIVGVE
ncbi:hypothetical protein [Amycolatopsis japonica]